MLSKEELIYAVKKEIDYRQELVDKINECTEPEEIIRRNETYQFWIANLYYLTKEK